MILLSVIIPFFNTFSRSEKVRNSIISTLEKYDNIEFLLINDGSTDDTLENLNQFFGEYHSNALLKIINQNNQGPGGARNHGLKLATGHYIWFVDSDDDLYIDNIYEDLLNNVDNSIDFIDYNFIEKESSQNSMSLSVGVYDAKNVDLYVHLGRIWTKIFKREFWIKNKILYPTHCIYEDNFLVYSLPVYIRSFIKRDKIAYFYTTDNVSITRSKISERFYDRVLTSYNGILFLYENKVLINQSIANRFSEIFLYNTVLALLINISVKNIFRAFYIVSTYKYLCCEYGIPKSQFTKSWKKKLVDLLSVFIPSKNNIDVFIHINKEQWYR